MTNEFEQVVLVDAVEPTVDMRCSEGWHIGHFKAIGRSFMFACHRYESHAAAVEGIRRHAAEEGVSAFMVKPAADDAGRAVYDFSVRLALSKDGKVSAPRVMLVDDVWVLVEKAEEVYRA